MRKSVKVFAPASVANLGVGYDILGLAINGPGDEIVAGFSNKKTLEITKISGDGGRLPYQPELNTAGYAVMQLLEHLNLSNIGISLEIHKKMPFGSGLGSSAASAAGAVWAVNLLLDSPLTKKELLHFAVLGEQIADGAYHADNVAPSLLGGIVLIRENLSLDIVELPVPDNLFITVVYPHISILTKDAREILKPLVNMDTVIQQTGNLSGLISSFFLSDFELMKRSLNDVWIEPQRAVLIPHFYELKSLALSHSSIGFSISGAGPSVFAFSNSKNSSEQIGIELQAHLKTKNISSTVFSSLINREGCVQI